MKCSLCRGRVHARGWCFHHYWAWWARGKAESARKKRGRPSAK